jgi:flagellar hook-length control protein FliK
VQILLDGGQAQIDFTAAHSRTREVLEAGWPALAAAMHSAGFTLGGGGVFEQRSQDGESQGDGRGTGSRRGSAADETPAVPGVTRHVGAGPRGLLDLYA